MAATEVSIRASSLEKDPLETWEEGSLLLSHTYESCEYEEGDASLDWFAVA